MPEVRAAAARCLQAIFNGQSLSRELPKAEKKLKPEQRPLLRELCYGSLRHFWRLEALAGQCLSKPFKEKDEDILMLLCIGIYQLEYMRIPPHAAINTTVDASKSLRKDWAKGLTNAVLRRFQRERDTLIADLTPPEACAHPDWLYEAIHAAWPDEADAILEANNQHPPLCLRNNARRQNRDSYLLALSAAGMEASACDFALEGIRLTRAVDVLALPGFAEGRVSVQDESAQLCADILRPGASMRVLDACAAPGGKSCHLLEHQPELALTCIDIDEARLERVQENLSRLKLSAQLLTGDAAKPDSWWDGLTFDQILLDAPCSATGVIRRNPDIKIHRRASDIPALADTQLNLLKALWATLKSGGQLLYATCSVLPAENEEVIERFLSHQPDAVHQTIAADWGLSCRYGRQLFPRKDEHDGFYYALLSKA
ncbi:MAG: 16S rRNA (cytosine967-C5)-methyltransferase [Bermanella sp.]|jgi:16S rRNA (cytosine967-C5)-methyltransferase